MASRPFADTPPIPPGPTPAWIEEYDKRRCAVCGAKYPSFGFGPPLTRPGITLWSCLEHRGQVEKQLRPDPPPAPKVPPTSLF
jgi:hypothetical protein